MSNFLKKPYVKRALRTFLQIAVGYIAVNIAATDLTVNCLLYTSLTVTNAEIAKYSLLYMAASWTQQETVNFCDVIPIRCV